MSDFKRYAVLKDVPTTTSGGITSAIGTADQLAYSYLCPVSGVGGDLAKLLEAAAKEIERLNEMEYALEDIWICANAGYSLDDLTAKISMYVESD